MSIIVFNADEFVARFPEFGKLTTAQLQGNWDVATAFISAEDYGYLHGPSRTQAIYLMAAHLAALSAMIADGQTPGMVTSTTIDKVSVTLTPPPVKTQFQYWLSLTPYGAQLLALLQMFAVGGMYIGGRPERSAFRKVCGNF